MSYIKKLIGSILANTSPGIEGQFRFFSLITEQLWNEDDAIEYQTTAGFSPQGYGFEGFKTLKITLPKPQYIITWKCGAKC